MGAFLIGTRFPRDLAWHVEANFIYSSVWSVWGLRGLLPDG